MYIRCTLKYYWLIMINILLIGLGPHARRIQLPILLKDGNQHNATVKCVIDLGSERTTVESYLHAKNVPNTIERLYLNKVESIIVDNQLEVSLLSRLDEIVAKHGINTVFICTEPTCHTAYAKWALQKGMHVFMDKPISAPNNLATSTRSVDQITNDFTELATLYKQQKQKHPNLVFELMAQRRYHPAFHEINRLIQEVQDRTGAPITSFQSTHSDGQWRMPDEIVDQHYHPYNEGYGKCLHSGYHSIDITNWLVRQSHSKAQEAKDVEVFSNFVYPNDFLAQLPLESYDNLFQNFENNSKYSPGVLADAYQSYGEIDAQISTAYKNASGKTITIGQLNLLHTAFGQRNWPTAEGRDLYKGNGRVRHEAHYLVQGPFQTIYFQSLQSQEILNEEVNHSDVGGEYHLDIHVFRNSKMFPEWKSYDKFGVKDLSINVLEGYSRGHQEDARRAAILTFLKSIHKPDTKRYSDILDQTFSIGIIGAAYRSALNRKLGKNPLVSIQDELKQSTRAHSIPAKEELYAATRS